MKQTISALLFFFTSLNCFGTAQIPDIVIYKGDTLSLFSCPLNFYPDEKIVTPKNLFGSSGCFYTACWRNYIATWVIEGDKLFLTKIRNACYPTEMRDVAASYKSRVNKDSIGSEYADLKKLFPNRYKDGKVLANWVNQTLISPRGKMLFYIHDGFESIYESELEFSVEDGVVIKTRNFDNSKTKKSKYTEDTNLLKKYIQEHIDYSGIAEPDKKVRVIISVRATTDDGKIDSVTVLRGSDKARDEEAIRVVKSIPEWNILYRHGKRFFQTWTIPVVFGKE